MAWWNVGIAAVGVVSGIDQANNAEHDRDVLAAEAAAAQSSAEAGAADVLAYYQSRDAATAALMAEANAIAAGVAEAQIGVMNQQIEIADDYHQRNINTFWPLEDTLVADAMNYDTPEKREAEAASAIADVGLQYGIEQQAQQRNKTRMGVNPASGNMDAMTNQLSLSAASAKSAAGNQARDNVELQGWARGMDAASLGRNLASAQATAANTAVSAGNSATNAAYAPVTAANQTTSLMGSGLSSGYNMMTNAGQLGLSSLPTDSSSSNYASQLAGLASQAANVYYGNQAATTANNLSYANGVSSTGGDGLGAFITSSGWA